MKAPPSPKNFPIPIHNRLVLKKQVVCTLNWELLSASVSPPNVVRTINLNRRMKRNHFIHNVFKNIVKQEFSILISRVICHILNIKSDINRRLSTYCNEKNVLGPHLSNQKLVRRPSLIFYPISLKLPPTPNKNFRQRKVVELKLNGYT